MRLDEIVDSFQLMSGEPGLVIREDWFGDNHHPRHECSIDAFFDGCRLRFDRFDPILQKDGDCAYRMEFSKRHADGSVQCNWVVVARSKSPFVAIALSASPIILRPSGRICELNHMGVVNT